MDSSGQLARMYVKAKDVKAIGVSFKSKTEQAVELAKWAYNCCKNPGRELWIVTDGGFTRASFLKSVIKMGVVVITRLRKDAALRALLKQVKGRKRGRPRKYGKRIKLQNIVNNRDRWNKVKALLYGEEEIKIEQNFSDIKEIKWAGQQQVRAMGSNIGTFHLNLWLHSLVELWAWDKSARVLCNRSDSPWDDANRRPFHADKCAALRREVLKRTFFETFGHSRKNRKIARQFYKLLKLAA